MTTTVLRFQFVLCKDTLKSKEMFARVGGNDGIYSVSINNKSLLVVLRPNIISIEWIDDFMPV